MKNSVTINLDRPRELRFGHKAMKTLTELTGRDLNNLVNFKNGIDLKEAEIFLYCGLLSDAQENGETLELDGIEDLLDQGDFTENIEKMIEAINLVFNTGDGSKTSEQLAKASEPKKARETKPATK